MAMRIDRDTVVTLACEVRDCDGLAIEEDGTAVAYLHGGYGGIFPKVENALQGGEVGLQVNLTLEPEDAFGDYDANLLRVETPDKFPEGIEVGMRFEGMPGERADEALIYTVTEVTPEAIVVDGNHPLAGERLWFKCTVTEVRKATEEELEHGHVHGEHGVHVEGQPAH
jgi:FKBP-type peptidyl-prolyl cis-trans isomerase SlyD